MRQRGGPPEIAGEAGGGYGYAANEAYSSMPEDDMFGRSRSTSSHRGSKSSSLSSSSSLNPASSNTTTSSMSRHGSKKLQSKQSRTGSTAAVFVFFVFNVSTITYTRGWFDGCLYFLCAALVAYLRGFTKLPKRFLSAVGIFLLAIPFCLWCFSSMSDMMTGSGDSSSFFSSSISSSTSSSSSSTTSASISSSTSSSSSSTTRSAPGTTETVFVPMYQTVNVGNLLLLHCPARGSISSVDFVSYGQPTSCVKWRATKECRADGEREEEKDLGCDQQVKAQSSGYCECSDGTTRAHSACGHGIFTCQQECERVVHCVGFRTTQNCDPKNGIKSSTLLECDEIVAPHVSGYCECSNGQQVQHSTCDHDPFTCEEACTADTARWPPFVIDDTCHHSKSMSVVNNECQVGRSSCSLSSEWAEHFFENDEHQGNHDPCPGRPGERRLHVRLTCKLNRKLKPKKTSVGEICKSTTDSLKKCLDHHIVVNVEKCQTFYDKVVECQKKAAELIN